MKYNFLLALITLITLSSCTIVRVATVESEKVPKIQNQFVFENDTVKISYYFWDNRGMMWFTVFNKLSQPLFIDWKNSSFIPNFESLSYCGYSAQTDPPIPRQTDPSKLSA